MKNTFYFFALVFLLFSCKNSTTDNIKFQDLEPITLQQFKKKNVQLNSALRFLNENDETVIFNKVEYDVFVGGQNVGTYIEKTNEKIAKNGVYKIDLPANFSPEKAFTDLDYGITKIKSDIVAEVKYEGYFTITDSNKKEEEVKFSKIQKVLFSNNKKLKLNENGTIIEK